MSSQHRQAIHSIHNKKFWTEFFYLYESLPALWDVNNPLYKNRQVKGDAYDIMVDKLREIEANADREDVLRKINIFRTNYRRECSRIALSLQEGRQYKSTLWYFDLLSFLQTADTRRERKRKFVDDGIEKSIMRKRRHIARHSEPFLLANKKGDIIEYPPQSGHATDIDYDNYDDPDFGYVVEDLSHSLSDHKNESNDIHNAIEMQGESFNDIDGDGHVDDDGDGDGDGDGDNSQTEYENEFKNFTLQRNDPLSIADSQNSKNSRTTDNIGITSTMNANDVNEGGGLIMADRGDEYEEYDNEASSVDNRDTVSNNNASLANSQWCLKNPNASAKNVTLSLPQCINLSTHDVATTSSCTSSKVEGHPLKIVTKMVRDANTMTSNKLDGGGGGQEGKISQSSEILAKSWAIQYDEMSQEQKILARKAINDILFDGCMGNLFIASNGRVMSCNSPQLKNQSLQKETMRTDFESGNIYQPASTTSSIAMPSNVTIISKTPHEWLKL